MSGFDRRQFLARSGATIVAASAFADASAAKFPLSLSKADLDFIRRNAPTALRFAAPIARFAFRFVPVVGQLSLALDVALTLSDIVELRQQPGKFRTQVGSLAAKKAMQRLSTVGVAFGALGVFSAANASEPRNGAIGGQLVDLLGGAGRLEAALSSIESIPGVVEGIIQNEFEAQNRARLETKLEEFGRITQLLEIEAASLPAIEPAPEKPSRKRGRNRETSDPFSDYYKNAYAPAARKLLPELSERLGDLRNYAAQNQRFAPATVSAVALGRTAVEKLSINTLESDGERAHRMRPNDAWLSDAIDPSTVNSLAAQQELLNGRIGQLESEAARTRAGCVTGNQFGAEIPYRAVRVGVAIYRRYYYYFINYRPIENDQGPSDAPLQYPVSLPAIGEIELSGYASRAERQKIEDEWERQSARYSGGRCEGRDLIKGTSLTDPDGMFDRLRDAPDAIDNKEIADMLADFREWRALLFAADAGRAQKVVFEQTTKIVRAALNR